MLDIFSVRKRYWRWWCKCILLWLYVKFKFKQLCNHNVMVQTFMTTELEIINKNSSSSSSCWSLLTELGEMAREAGEFSTGLQNSKYQVGVIIWFQSTIQGQVQLKLSLPLASRCSSLCFLDMCCLSPPLEVSSIEQYGQERAIFRWWTYNQQTWQPVRISTFVSPQYDWHIRLYSCNTSDK